MKKFLLLIIATAGFFAMAVNISAEEFTLDYLEGEMEINQDGSWVEAMIGDTISGNTQLKLDEESIAEFSSDNSRLTISNSGVYSLEDILNKKKRVSSLGFGTVVQNTYRYVAGKQKSTSSAVMGVRGAKADNSNDIAWMDEEDEQLSQGKDLIKEKKFKDAVSVLNEGFKNADPDTEQEYLYYLGYSYAMLGENAKALKYFSGVKADGTEDYFGDYVLVKGQLLMDSLSYEKALVLFNRYISAYPDGANTQVSYFMAGICLNELGKKGKARDSFKQAQRIDPKSEVGKAAQRVINKL